LIAASKQLAECGAVTEILQPCRALRPAIRRGKTFMLASCAAMLYK